MESLGDFEQLIEKTFLNFVFGHIKNNDFSKKILLRLSPQK
jgi:hypothetical protein